MDKAPRRQPISDPTGVHLSISAVARDTGLSKDTLRVWERRYGFPSALRVASGERVYTQDVVDRLRLLKRLTDRGLRPGQLMTLEIAELERLAQGEAAAVSSGADAQGADAHLDACLEDIRSHDVSALSRRLRHRLACRGLLPFVHELAVPLLRRVGDAWLRGTLQVYQEHMLTEQLLAVLHEGIRALPQPLPDARPRILLGTVPGEPHALALLLAQALCAADGAHCIPLGPQTPLSNLLLAADAYRADIVLLGFSGCGTPNEVVDGLTELRGKLAPAVELWAGGAVPVLQRRRPEGVELLEGLDVLASRLHQWRSARNLV